MTEAYLKLMSHFTDAKIEELDIFILNLIDDYIKEAEEIDNFLLDIDNIIESKEASNKIQTSLNTNNARMYYKNYVMTESETIFFNQIKARLKAKYDKEEFLKEYKEYSIFPQMPLISCIKLDFDYDFKHINRRMDFCIVRKTFKDSYITCCLIELDDASHDKPEQKLIDEKIDSICKKFNFELIRVRAKKHTNEKGERILVDYSKDIDKIIAYLEECFVREYKDSKMKELA